MSKDADELARAWAAARSAAGIDLDPHVAATWVELLLEGPERRSELEALIALHARGLGESGRRASLAVLQVSLLDRLRPDLDTVPLVAVAADAHAIGAATRLERRARSRLRSALPVLPLPSGDVVAALVGPIDGDLLDALLGRAFVAAVQSQARRVILDLAGVEDLDLDLVLATAAAFPRHELADRLSLVLSGLDDPASAEARLQVAGAPTVRCVRRTSDLHNP